MTERKNTDVVYTIIPTVLYGKGTVKIVDGASSYIEDGETYYQAKKGNTITIEITPEANWNLSKVLYMTGAWTTPDLKLTKVEGKDNQYTFTIPDDAVEYEGQGSLQVYIQFAPVMEEGQNEVRVTAEHISTDVYAAKAGDTVKLTSVSDSAARAYNPVVTDENGNEVALTRTEAVIDTENNQIRQTYTFIMPEKMVTVDEKSNRKCAVTLKTNDDSKFAGHVTYDSTPSMSSNMSVMADNIIDGKYYKHEVSLRGTVGNTDVKTGAFVSLASGKATYQIAKTLPLEAELTVNFIEADAYDITDNTDSIEGGTFTITNGKLAAEDDTVTMVLTPVSADGYYYDGTTLPVVTDTDGNPVAVTDSRGYEYFTTDGTQFTASSTTTDLENALVYPGKAVVDVPDYFDLTENNEIYLTGFIDGMSKDTNLKLKLTAQGAPEVKKGTAHIAQFGEYDVDVEVTVENDIITDVQVTGKNFSGTHAKTNERTLQDAIDGLKGQYVGKSSKDANEIAGVDVVSGATYSSNAIRDAILNALDLTMPEEEINLPTEALTQGEYSVDIAYYTDKVKHSLLENEKRSAKIVVDKNGKMTLVTDIVNGTEKEPLYVYKFNGYYEGNDTTKTLKTDAAVEMSDTDYSDDVFGKDEKVRLAEGTYTIPAKLMNATNPSQDSMAAGCVKEATMTVDKDGTAKITLKLGSVTVGNVEAYASNWMIYQGLDTKSDKVSG